MAKSDLKTLIVDGSSYLFRAYHALPPLTSPQGEPSGALYGIMNMMRKMLEDHPCDRLVVVFDPKGETTRHGYYPEYKANREAMPEALQKQIAPIHAMIEAMGMPMVVVPGIEADDVIGTLAREAREAGHRVLISTGDKDMAQLVDDQVSLINTMRNTVMDAAGVVEKFGVRPNQIVDYLALIGDTVDNIPGIPKVGPKTAAKWLGLYDSLDGVVAHAHEIKGKVGELLREHLDQLPLSQRLVTIDCAVPLALSLDDCQRRAENVPSLLALCERFGFSRWRQLYQAKLLEGSDVADPSHNEDKPTRTYDCVLSEAALDAWLARLAAAPHFALDTETDGLDPHVASLVGLSFAVGAGEAAYVPLAHVGEDVPTQLDRALVLAKLGRLLSDPERVVVGHNIKFDWHVLVRHGVTWRAKLRDTMVASYVCHQGQGSHGMDALAAQCLGVDTIRFEDVAGKGRTQVTFDQVPLDKATPYAAEDADITWQLDAHFMPKLDAAAHLAKVYHTIEMPLLPVLAQIEHVGVRVDARLLRVQSAALGQRLEALSEAIFQAAGRRFNVDSPKQLQEVLYDEMQLPVLKKTPKGQPSTAEPVLQQLALSHPIVADLMGYRSLNKLRSTYTERLPEQVNVKTGRIHTSYNQAVTITGRLSSTQPNLQNIPIRTEEGRRIRQAFIPAEGCVMLAADYSQIELRIMAHLSEDAGLLSAFARGEDIHRATAAEVYQLPIDQVSDLQRRHAKAINFGLIYGMSAFGLSQQLGTTRELAQQMMDTYFEKYPGVLRYMERIRQEARAKGYVETLLGRRMPTPDINAKQVMRQKAAERAAINAPMQGTAADIIKVAMLRVAAWLCEQALQSQMIMQVHDELVLEVPRDELALVACELPVMMSQAVSMRVPLEVSVGIGVNWDQAH